MIVIADMFQQINDMLPKGEKVHSFSVIPLDYSGYYEIYVETGTKRRFRCLATGQKTLSNMTEWLQPNQLQIDKQGK